jgi:hypothetical protein
LPYGNPVHFNPGKTNVVANALSRKVHCNYPSVESYNETLCAEMQKMKLEIVPQGTLNHIFVEPTLFDQVIMAQLHDKGVRIIKQKLSEGEEKYKFFRVDHKGILWFDGRLVVPKNPELRKQIFDEAHLSKFSIHLGSTKMYQDLRQNFWWT